MAAKSEVNQSLEAPPEVIVNDLTMGDESFVQLRDLNFTLQRWNIFIIMGGSGCGESSRLRRLVGLKDLAKGEIIYGDLNFTTPILQHARIGCADSEFSIGRCAVEFDDQGSE